MPTNKTLKRPFIVFGQPDIGEEEIQAVTDVMRSGWIGTGRVARQFEEEFARYMGGGYAISVSSCSIGLVIALKSVGICHGDNVLTTPLTFCATVNAILQAGGKPVFKDVNQDGMLDFWIDDLKGKETVVTVNYTGNKSVSKRLADIPIIEDAAHSFGGFSKSGKHGTFSDISVFSFYANKNITSGEGGMIWTRSKELADKCRILSNNGQSNGAWARYSSGPINNYQVLHPGVKGNLPDILAAIGLTQLRRYPELRNKRNKIWNIYQEAFGEKELGHSQHLYTIMVKNRLKVREDLYNMGIGTGIHYEALHLEPAYKYLGYKKGDFPIAEKIGSQTLSLPLSNTMNVEDANYVVSCVKEILGEMK
jgi:dTDP-4-amino-4,6-dideoxygalactose transaminase